MVVDGNLITSQGPGTALEFAGGIIASLLGDTVSKKVLDTMLVRY